MTEQRLREIADRNYRNVQYGGMTGAIEAFSITVEDCKHNAAANLISHRQCVVANRKFGRTYKGDYWLNRASLWRKTALRLKGIIQ